MTDALLGPLAARLPGLAVASDAQQVARQIQQTLFEPGGQVHWVMPSDVWYRIDGSLSLRYRVAVTMNSAEVTEHTILGRVFPAVNGGGDGSITLQLFPADPDYPTLAPAMDLAALVEGGWPSPDVPVSVELVHFSRQGAPVLRYGVRRAGASPTSPIREVYGKVYPDPATGEQVYAFLRSWSRPGPVPIPSPIGYSPRLRLLLTESLPGQPVLPSVVRAAARLGPDSPAWPGGSADAALRSTGHALAALHRAPYTAAPARTLDQLRSDLDRELTLVGAVWPSIADRVRGLLDGLDTEGGGLDPVLCHGDFTPAQVLFEGPSVSGIVDFDTVCSGDAAMDVGRFLAHLDLLVVKEVGPVAERMREQLGGSFLAGYGEAAGRTRVDGSFLRRVDRYRTMSWARTALHACRQLKERRMTLALSLLSTADERIRA